jgi:hypothetical protein
MISGCSCTKAYHLTQVLPRPRSQLYPLHIIYLYNLYIMHQAPRTFSNYVIPLYMITFVIGYLCSVHHSVPASSTPSLHTSSLPPSSSSVISDLEREALSSRRHGRPQVRRGLRRGHGAASRRLPAQDCGAVRSPSHELVEALRVVSRAFCARIRQPPRARGRVARRDRAEPRTQHCVAHDRRAHVHQHGHRRYGRKNRRLKKLPDLLIGITLCRRRVLGLRGRDAGHRAHERD